MNHREVLELAEWRRLVAEMYAKTRGSSAGHAREAWEEYRSTRTSLFATHPQSPLDRGRQMSFDGLPYFSYDPAWRIQGRIVPLSEADLDPELAAVTEDLPEGKLTCRPFARVLFDPPDPPGAHDRSGGGPLALTLYWLESYGGGLFLPFRDLTSGRETYGGGRYLYDTIKGADLGAGPDAMLLDFNYAYNPSCAYNPRWVCPLAPRENDLSLRIEAGEMIKSEPEASSRSNAEGPILEMGV